MDSEAWFRRAQGVIPGGVNSPVRAFRAVGGTPVFIERAEGALLTAAGGRRYLDYVGSWGPMILGHAHPEVVEAVRSAAGRGTSYGAPTADEVELAEEIVAALPSVDMVRLVNSGTEAVMSALRVARAYTGRDVVVKFAGCYHGHSDGLLVQAGSGVTTLGIPDSPGVPAAVAALTLNLSYNAPAGVEEVFRQRGREIAAVIVEPVVGNMGTVVPQPGFLQHLRELTKSHGSLLIFDEVITGFRVGYGGAQGLFGIIPDLTCLGKIIGGGLPVGAYGGRREIMELVAPAGPVYQAGTLSGNPLAVAAGLATLKLLREPGFYARLEEKAGRLVDGLALAAQAAGVQVRINSFASLFTVFFTGEPVRDYASAKTADPNRYAAFFHALLRRGMYFPPAQWEAAFLSAAHTEADLERTAAAAREAFAEMKPK